MDGEERRGDDVHAVVCHHPGEHVRRRAAKPCTVSGCTLAPGNVIAATHAEDGNLDLGEGARAERAAKTPPSWSEEIVMIPRLHDRGVQPVRDTPRRENAHVEGPAVVRDQTRAAHLSRHRLEERQLAGDIGQEVLLELQDATGTPPEANKESSEMPGGDADRLDVEHEGLTRQRRALEHLEPRTDIYALTPGEHRPRRLELGSESQLGRPNDAPTQHGCIVSNACSSVAEPAAPQAADTLSPHA